jgi:signal transduction histidine kinase
MSHELPTPVNAIVGFASSYTGGKVGPAEGIAWRQICPTLRYAAQFFNPSRGAATDLVSAVAWRAALAALSGRGLA